MHSGQPLVALPLKEPTNTKGNTGSALGFQTSAQTPQSPVFFDAYHTHFDAKGEQQHFDGEVVAIAQGTLISADKMSFNRKLNQFTASGHVIVLAKSQVLTGENLLYNLTNSEFTIQNSFLVSNDVEATREVQSYIFGHDSKELEFEESKKKQLSRITQKKTALIKEFQSHPKGNTTQLDAIISNYATLLAQESQVKQYKYKPLRRSQSEEAQIKNRRRKFWLQTMRDMPTEKIDQIGYFSLKGEVISKLDQNRFAAKEAFFTPCMCEQEETPVWGFRTDELTAQSEGYAVLKNPVLELKGMPILYLPYLKIPLKTKRQSGFLVPSISHSSSNGNVISQPIYFAFSENADATITTDFIEKRGFRLGIEHRIKQREFSGWSFKLEALRDQAWLTQQSQRRNLVRSLAAGIELAQSPPVTSKTADTISDPSWLAANGLANCLQSQEPELCEQFDLKQRFLAPDNTWRGELKWSGQTIIAPRLAFISNGEILSDHRYPQDLHIPNIQNLFSSPVPSLFAKSKFKLHLDAKDFYSGIGARFADQTIDLQRYGGYQLPLSLKLQTRMFGLFSRYSKIPVYTQLSWQQHKISLNDSKEFIPKPTAKNTRSYKLGAGNWQRFTLKSTSPLISDRIIQSHHFTEAEYRLIKSELNQQAGHPNDNEVPSLEHSHYNSIHSLKTGVQFSLPIDGRMLIAQNNNPSLPASASTVLEHHMNWNMTLSWRPYVVRRGNYGTFFQNYKIDPDSKDHQQISQSQLTYFTSDQDSKITHDLIPSDSMMSEHQKIIFQTSHDWLLSSREWITDYATNSTDASQESTQIQNYYQQARQQLMYSLEKVATKPEDIISSDNEWRTTRYHQSGVHSSKFLHFDATINYDFIEEKKRGDAKQKILVSPSEKPVTLPEPWSPLDAKLQLNWHSWNLSGLTKYNLYHKSFPTLQLSLRPPSFFNSSLNTSYTIDKESQAQPDGTFSEVRQTITKTVGLSTAIFQHHSLGLNYGVKINGDPKQSNLQRKEINWSYKSPTNCWGFLFKWEEDYLQSPWKGTYFFAITIRFLSHSRDFSNLTSRFNDA